MPATEGPLSGRWSEGLDKRVPGLQQTDFTLLDNKQPRKILSFRAIDVSKTTGSLVEVVLLVDGVNTPSSSVARVREGIEKFLGGKRGRTHFRLKLFGPLPRAAEKHGGYSGISTSV